MFPTWPSKGEKYVVAKVDDAQGCYHCTREDDQLNVPLINFYLFRTYPHKFVAP